MIPLSLFCLVACGQYIDIDTRPIHRQIIDDQLTKKENPIYNRNKCNDGFHVRTYDPRNRDCRI